MGRIPQVGPASDPEMLILASLADGRKHGGATMKDIERNGSKGGQLALLVSFSGSKLPPGTLYAAITRLVEQGWIEPEKSNIASGPTESPELAFGISRANLRHAQHCEHWIQEAALLMKRWIIQNLLRLYHAKWRNEYGAEFEDLLFVELLQPTVILNVIGGRRDNRFESPITRPARFAAAPS
jgi:hypothetical protein